MIIVLIFAEELAKEATRGETIQFICNRYCIFHSREINASMQPFVVDARR